MPCVMGLRAVICWLRGYWKWESAIRSWVSSERSTYWRHGPPWQWLCSHICIHWQCSSPSCSARGYFSRAWSMWTYTCSFSCWCEKKRRDLLVMFKTCTCFGWSTQCVCVCVFSRIREKRTACMFPPWYTWLQPSSVVCFYELKEPDFNSSILIFHFIVWNQVLWRIQKSL